MPAESTQQAGAKYQYEQHDNAQDDDRFPIGFHSFHSS
jgi:hypothetical protein